MKQMINKIPPLFQDALDEEQIDGVFLRSVKSFINAIRVQNI